MTKLSKKMLSFLLASALIIQSLGLIPAYADEGYTGPSSETSVVETTDSGSTSGETGSGETGDGESSGGDTDLENPPDEAGTETQPGDGESGLQPEDGSNGDQDGKGDDNSLVENEGGLSPGAGTEAMFANMAVTLGESEFTNFTINGVTLKLNGTELTSGDEINEVNFEDGLRLDVLYDFNLNSAISKDQFIYITAPNGFDLNKILEDEYYDYFKNGASANWIQEVDPDTQSFKLTAKHDMSSGPAGLSAWVGFNIKKQTTDNEIKFEFEIGEMDLCQYIGHKIKFLGFFLPLAVRR